MTLSRSRVRHLGALNRKPVGVERRLFLEVALKCIGNVLQSEGAHGTSGYAVGWCGERAIHQLGSDVAILALDQFRCGFCRAETDGVSITQVWECIKIHAN